MEQNREPRNKLTLLWSINIWQRSKHIQWANDSLFNKWCWENWTDTCRKMKLDHLFMPHTRINSKWVKDLNVGLKTINILKENIGNITLDISHSSIFFWYISSGKGNKRKKINKWDYIKLKLFFTAKETINKIKR